VVIPAYNEASCLGALYHELSNVCRSLPYDFEFIFVDDGSKDQTDAVLAGLRAQDDRVRYLVMSRNFGHQGAISAGLAFASGDAVIMMDGDLQHPPSLLPRLLECWESGFDVVNTIRLETQDGSLVKKLFSRAFYAVFRTLTGFPIERGSADFRLMARGPLDALNGLPERHRFIRGLVPWLGFRQTSVRFRAPARWAGSPKFTFRKSARLAMEGVTAFSLYPLRGLALFGMFVAAASLACGAGALLWQSLGGGAAAGWTAVLICVHFFAGCQLAALGIISEYLGRTLDQVKGRPLYILKSAIGFAAIERSESGAIPPPHFARSATRGEGEMARPGRHEVAPAARGVWPDGSGTEASSGERDRG
jgi:dolichol-phosphate mannosyltransferase